MNWMARVAVLGLLGCVGCLVAVWFLHDMPRPPAWRGGVVPALLLIASASAVVTVVALLDVIFGGHRHRTGWQRCIHCGYDLRYTPDRCPECGAIPEPEPAGPKDP